MDHGRESLSAVGSGAAELSVCSKLSKAVCNGNVYKTWILTPSLFCTELFVFFVPCLIVII